MKPFHSWIWVCVFTLAPGALALPQQDVVRADSVEIATGQSAALAASAEVSVLRLVKLSGVVQDALGQPRTGVVGITFALYQEQEGGAPLWLETQNAQLDEQGRYTVLLGSESSEGLPLEIFSSTEARWLGVTVQGEEEQSRVLLVSVPYALKAADAERLGGQLAATFISKDPETGQLLAGGEVLDSSALAEGGGTSAQVVSGDVGRIAKFTASDAVGNSVMFESAGFIGVGTTSPTELLHVHNGKIQMTRDDGNFPLFALHNLNAGGHRYTFQSEHPNGSLAIRDSTVGANRLVVDAGGFVGIGTTSPTELLHIHNGKIQMTRDDGNFPLFALDNLAPGGRRFTFQSEHTTGNLAIRDSTAGANRFIVDPTGNIGIGTTSPSEKLHVVGNVLVSGDVTATSLTEISSRRWKSNIQPLTDALEKVERLRGVTYDLKNNNKHDIGLIAEEVGEVVPEVVAQDENGQANSVNYGRLTALLVEAVKEQQAQIRALQEELAALKAGQATPAGRP